jgi:hypothetical protein
MSTRLQALAFVAVLALAGGCSKSQSTSLASNAGAAKLGSLPQSGASAQPSGPDADAIRAAIEDHLRSNSSLNLDAMEMTVDSVNVKGSQAQAHASFYMKNGGASGMTMEYFLQRSGNAWVVTNGQPADGNMQLPPSNAAPSGASTTQATPPMPDVDAFFKDHPGQKSN